MNPYITKRLRDWICWLYGSESCIIPEYGGCGGPSIQITSNEVWDCFLGIKRTFKPTSKQKTNKTKKKNGKNWKIIINPWTMLVRLATAKSLQSCPTPSDPIDGGPPGSPVPGILQARTLEWVAVSFSNAWKWKVKVKSLSRVQLLATLWTAAYQAPLSMGLSRQEYWSRVPLWLYPPLDTESSLYNNWVIKESEILTFVSVFLFKWTRAGRCSAYNPLAVS